MNELCMIWTQVFLKFLLVSVYFRTLKFLVGGVSADVVQTKD